MGMGQSAQSPHGLMLPPGGPAIGPPPLTRNPGMAGMRPPDMMNLPSEMAQPGANRPEWVKARNPQVGFLG